MLLLLSVCYYYYYYKAEETNFVTPGVDPTLHALERFKLLITEDFPVFGKPINTQININNIQKQF